MANRKGPYTYSCYACGVKVLRTNRHRYNSIRYCNDCWELYQTAWKHNIETWIDSHGDNIKSLDCYPQLKGKGYYATIDGNIYSTKYIYRPKGTDGFKTFYLPHPIKYPVPVDNPIFHYGDKRNGMFIKDIIYNLFVEPLDKQYIVVNKDYDIFNNAADNLIKFPRHAYIHYSIYYAVKNGRRIAESTSAAGLAKMLKMHENTVRDLIRTGKKTKHGVYLKKE